MTNYKQMIIFLQQEQHVKAMIQAAQDGKPAILGVSAALLQEFPDLFQGKKVDKWNPVAGKAVWAVMEEQGYEQAKTIRILNDKQFSKAMTYTKRKK